MTAAGSCHENMTFHPPFPATRFIYDLAFENFFFAVNIVEMHLT
jgi:hypothetical protein